MHPKAATIALVVKPSSEQLKDLQIVEILSNDKEISLLETGLESGDTQALGRIYEYRDTQAREDNEFADYVEELLSQPFVKTEIQEHGIQWLKSKIRIEEFEKTERDAAKIIADYALKVFRDDPQRRDFLLAGPKAQVRVRIFIIEKNVEQRAA